MVGKAIIIIGFWLRANAASFILGMDGHSTQAFTGIAPARLSAHLHREVGDLEFLGRPQVVRVQPSSRVQHRL